MNTEPKLATNFQNKRTAVDARQYTPTRRSERPPTEREYNLRGSSNSTRLAERGVEYHTMYYCCAGGRSKHEERNIQLERRRTAIYQNSVCLLE